MEDEIYKVDDFEYSMETDESGNEYLILEGYSVTVTEGHIGGAEEITIPSTVTIDGKDYPVTKIGNGAFWNCRNLLSVTIPDSVTYIGEGAFEDCESIESYVIPDSVGDNIGKDAFGGCDSFMGIPLHAKEIILPSSWVDKSYDELMETGIDPFETTVYIHDKNQKCNVYNQIAEQDGFQCILTNNGAKIFKYSGFDEELIIPSFVTKKGKNGEDDEVYPVTEIEDGAFASYGNRWYDDYDNKNVKSITIPDSVVRIGKTAFDGCKSLESVTITNPNVEFSESAFDYSNFKIITLPESWENKTYDELIEVGIDPTKVTIHYGSQDQGQNQSQGKAPTVADLAKASAPTAKDIVNALGASKIKTPAETNTKSRK